jgi:hypothetical protein
VIEATERWEPPRWALLERQLLAASEDAAERFVDRYARPDGTLVFRRDWPGVDGADDPYEGFQALALVHALGGGGRLLADARRLWEGITSQWTAYGQIRDEFFAAYDWLHHGEGNHLLYWLSLAGPTAADRERAVRFADLYAGEGSPNYDAERRLVRSPWTGSAGPRTHVSPDDLETARWVFDMYPPPFEDLPEVPLPERAPVLGTSAIDPWQRVRSAWSDDRYYAAVLERFEERMVRGDVPLNLVATGLVAHAFLHAGEERHRRWVLDYIDAWSERTERNGGLLPDNVGLSGEVGEYTGGRWWGGYYGYRWPHGMLTILEPLLVGAMSAALLDGDLSRLDLPRSQLDAWRERGRDDGGRRLVPQRHDDAGWTDEAPLDPTYALWLWAFSHAGEDRERLVRDLPAELPEVGEILFNEGNSVGHHLHWFEFLEGRRPGYPEAILEANLSTLERKVTELDEDDLDPELMDVHHWQDRSPLRLEGLVQLTLGAPYPVYHGGLLHATVRHFDPVRRRPGLPEDVAALVDGVSTDAVSLQLVNVGDAEREVVVQAGAFGEHAFEDGGRFVHVRLAPHAGMRLRLGLRRRVATPNYDLPWP